MRVIETSPMKKSTKAKERIFIDDIQKMFNVHYETLMNTKPAISGFVVEYGPKPKGKTAEFHLELIRKIERDLRKAPGKNLALYTKLLDELSKETRLWLSELHSDYWSQFDGPHLSLKELKELYRVSVIRHYLKANAKGRDLHVIYHGGKRCPLLMDLSTALAQKINAEWNINDLNVSQILANKIIQ